jgi:hypothetical protein
MGESVIYNSEGQEIDLNKLELYRRQRTVDTVPMRADFVFEWLDSWRNIWNMEPSKEKTALIASNTLIKVEKK